MSAILADWVRAAGTRLRGDGGPVAEGVLTRVVGMTLEATGFAAALGQRCLIRLSASRAVQAEVVGFASDAARIPALTPWITGTAEAPLP